MKNVFISIYLLMFLGCNAQTGNNKIRGIKTAQQGSLIPSDISIYGNWKCVASNYKGLQKFSLEQAKMLEKSVLNIQATEMHYENVDFVEPCKYKMLSSKIFDTSEYHGTLEFLYYKETLSKVLEFTPVDDNGELSCYNECVSLYLKEDTLINICGGYTLFFAKLFNDTKEYNGVGSTTERFLIRNDVKEVKLSYEFFTDEDQLTILDENNNPVFSTEMGSTNTRKSVVFSINKAKMLIIKINSKSSSSRWRLILES